MLKALFDDVMDRRSTRLIAQIGPWLPTHGPLLDVGSGTGHLSARLARELAVDVVPTDVTDMHVVGRAPVLMADGQLPFGDDTFAAALLVFMLHYPGDPAALLREVTRVTRGPIIVVQSLFSGRFGYTWLRAREFVWTSVAFHVSRRIGYVPADARFTMNARRFYSAERLQRDVRSAGLRVAARMHEPVLPRDALVVAALRLEHDA